MRAQLIKFLSALRASYWFIPSLMVIGAIVLSLVTVAGSMITVAGVTFSLTLLPVSHATGQFGPRLLTNFMRDRGNQITLGTFIATFIYCLMILRTVLAADESASGESDHSVVEFVPHISIFCAMLLTLASVALLIYFIHHVPESIRISHVLSDVGRELYESCDQFFPVELGEGEAATGHDPVHELPDHFEELSGNLTHPQNGYIQALDETGIMQTAVKYDLQIRLYARPGDFVSKGSPLMAVSPAERLNDAEFDLRSALAYGGHRTATGNPLFLVDQLVEVAMRALSPGVNDPLTAFTCIDWLQCCLIQLSNRDSISDYRHDSTNQLRFITDGPSYADFARAIFDQLRPYVAVDRNAAIHMMKMIGHVIAQTERPDRRELLLDYADELLDAAKHADMFGADVTALRKIRERLGSMKTKQ